MVLILHPGLLSSHALLPVKSATDIISGPELLQAMNNLVDAVLAVHEDPSNLVLVSIANGGISLGQWLQAELTSHYKQSIPSGVVDITFHRDDIGLQPISKISLPTALEFSIDDATVLLVDDVLDSGRTARAAINELFDQGRPASIELLVMFDKMNHLLPIRPDFVGFSRKDPSAHRVRLDLDPNQPEQAKIFFE